MLTACGAGSEGTGETGASSAEASVAAQAAAEAGVLNSLKRRLLAAPSRLAVAVVAEPDPMLEGLTIPPDAVEKGLWSPVHDWPMNAIHLALGVDGKVLSYGSHLGRPAVAFGQSFDWWTPSLGFGPEAHRSFRKDVLPDSFCSSATWLPDGRLLRVGGGSPLQTTVVDMGAQLAEEVNAPLGNDRWYGTAVTLGDGRVVAVGGLDENAEDVLRDDPEGAIANGIVSMTPEIFTMASGWRTLPGATSRPAFGPDQRRANYPRAWVAPGGDVFGISNETLWSLDVDANAGAGATRVVGTFKGPISATNPVNVGAVSTAVMYAPGRILQVGGNGGAGGEATPGTNQATTFDINGAVPVVTETTPMTQVRALANSVVLPDGRVLVTGGTRFGNRIGPDAVYEAEIWNPATGLWLRAASAAVERVYHSTAMLLPNGTVMSAGGGAPGPVSNQNVEIFYPPYLFKSVNGVAQLAPRPTITGLNAKAFGHGQVLQLELASGDLAQRLVLLRTGTVTHAFNNNQRFIELPFTQTGDLVEATMPANRHIAPLGVYLLAVVDAAGVPSKAVPVTLGLQGSTPAPAPVLNPGEPQFWRTAVATTPLEWHLLPDGSVVARPPSDTLAPVAALMVRGGLADGRCVSLESRNAPGRWLRHAGHVLAVTATDNSADSRARATFCPERAPGGRGHVLRAFSDPGHVVHIGAEGTLSLAREVPDRAFVQTSAFEAQSLVDGTPNQPPKVSVTAPRAGASLSPGTVTISSNPGDADGYVTRVEFYDGATLIGTRTQRPWAVDWAATAGAHSLSVRAVDNKGAVGTSAAVAVTVLAPVNASPSVTMNAPANGVIRVAGTPITLSAAASDADGLVRKVEFFDGATLIATRTAAPWAVTWQGSTSEHLITARATDDRGAISTSTEVHVILQPFNTPPNVQLLAPTAAQAIAAGSAVTLAAKPGDKDGFVRRVEFYDGVTLIGSATASPWTAVWTAVAGPHTLTAKAIDNNGAATVSLSVTVNVAP